MSDMEYAPGFQGFVCTISGEQVSAAECLACAEAGAPGCNYGNPAIIAGIINGMRRPDFSLAAAQSERDDVAFDFGFSATELLGCPRKQRLSQEYPWWESPQNLYWAFRGTLMHTAAEAHAGANPFALVEDRLFWFIRWQGQVIGLSGAPDLLVYEPTLGGWKLIDYKTIKQIRSKLHRHICPETGKTMSDMPFPVRGKQMYCKWCDEKHPKGDLLIVKVDFQPRGSHREQLQIYSLLVEKNAARLTEAANAQLRAAGRQAVVPADAAVIGAELVYMDMARMVRLEVDIWSYETRVAFLKERLAAAITLEMPPVLDNPDQTWQCNYCPVASTCAGLVKIDEPFNEEKVLVELGF